MDYRRRLQYANPSPRNTRWFDGLLIGDEGKSIIAGCLYGFGLALMMGAYFFRPF